ncbi:MAG: enoyl-CoA hydratase/isomerase family protein [Polyangiaceae bacterium]
MIAHSPIRSSPPAAEGGVRVEDAGAVRTLVLDRPSRKNAFTVGMYRTMTRALAEAASSDATSVVRLASSSAIFSAGNDFHVMLEGSIGDVDGEEFARTAVEFHLALAQFPKPVIGEVGGLAAGAGATLLLHCDVVVATTTACFEFPSTRLGVLPDGGSSFLLPARVGLQRAMDWLLFGERVDVETARQAGIVTTVVVREQLTRTVVARADALSKLPQVTLREMKRLLREPFRKDLEEAIVRESKAISDSLRAR